MSRVAPNGLHRRAQGRESMGQQVSWPAGVRRRIGAFERTSARWAWMLSPIVSYLMGSLSRALVYRPVLIWRWH